MTRLLRAGSEENVLLTSKGQLQDGQEVHLLHGPDSSRDLVDRLVPDLPLIEVPNLVRPIRGLQDLKAFYETRDILRRLKPDVVHTHQSKAGVIGRAAARAAGVPCVVHGVHILPFIGASGMSRFVYLRAEKAAARWTHGFIHVSEGMRSSCLDNGIGKSVSHDVIPSGFDVDRFRTATRPDDWADLLDVDGTKEKPLTILMMAALEPRKRHLELLDVLPPIVAAHPSVRIVFAGEGPLANEIKAKARTLGIERAICMAGYRNDPERLIALSDISILSSRQEGLPRCILQSVVGGKPTVAFDLPGLDAIVQDGKNGCVIKMDDWTAFGKTLLGLVTDDMRRTHMAIEAAATDLSDWDWRRMGPRTDAFYREVLRSAA